jgi:hypothetical protein
VLGFLLGSSAALKRLATVDDLARLLAQVGLAWLAWLAGPGWLGWWGGRLKGMRGTGRAGIRGWRRALARACCAADAGAEVAHAGGPLDPPRRRPPCRPPPPQVHNVASTCAGALQRNAAELSCQVSSLQGELAATLEQFDGITDATRVGGAVAGLWGLRPVGDRRRMLLQPWAPLPHPSAPAPLTLPPTAPAPLRRSCRGK